MAEVKPRYLDVPIKEDLENKMVFIGGPRQVGKTTLARRIADHWGSTAYFNWDRRSHRQAILRELWPPDTQVIIFDEIHKFPRWKTFIKGLWDTRRHGERIMVTGSSRLDIYRRGGDSLMGRYHYFRLHPFSLREMEQPILPAVNKENPLDLQFGRDADLTPLLRFGGFPEPLLSQSERIWRRWRKERFERIFREDIRETEMVRSLSQVELLAGLLPQRIGSPLSIKSLAEDVEASPKTIQSWLDLLARNYYLFKVPPYHRRLERALKKEAKFYLWDWSGVEGEGPRFENLVASHLLKWCHCCEDVLGFRVELYYLRDLEKREVDFLILWEGRPWLLVECKVRNDRNFTPLNYFGRRLKVKHCFLVTLKEGEDYEDRRTGVRVIPASRFLMALV
jgi:uncharacterized protein